MGLPGIGSYPMPDRTALPRSHGSWRIDPMRAALLVHDMQNHFVGAFPTGRSPVVELVDNVATLRELAGTLGMPVVFSAEPAGQAPGPALGRTQRHGLHHGRAAARPDPAQGAE
ncbi:isochorismatase family protein [Streptomyces sp. NPDC046465]|uniref:isochorismatase family protein n=1 Tax=Streptomyces sp. NPDC046465 TaxID=3155810 RepID=UPI0033E327D6